MKYNVAFYFFVVYKYYINSLYKSSLHLYIKSTVEPSSTHDTLISRILFAVQIYTVLVKTQEFHCTHKRAVLKSEYSCNMHTIYNY